MVGALGVVANAVGNSRVRRDSRNSQHESEGISGTGVKRRPTISEILASRHALAAGGTIQFRLDKDPDYHGGGPPVLQPPAPPPEKLSLAEQIKFYISLTLGILASLCVFALLFLIPLVVEPSISTLLADFDPDPATCVTTDSSVVTGLTKCSTFSSCREGCTNTPYSCYQIYVSYRRPNSKKGYPKLNNFTILHNSEWMDESKWDESYTQLFINVKGCGYPPRVKCEEFGLIYGTEGRVFNCYYSRGNPRLVVTDYNWEETAYPLLFSLGVPTVLFTLSISVLSFWYCPSCEERGKNKRPCRSLYTVPRSQEVDNYKRRISKQDEPKSKNNSVKRRNAKDKNQSPEEEVVVQQPRRKYSVYNPNSPSLATISSGDTTCSSINSLDDGWQSPPSPTPGLASRMNYSSKSISSTKTRKL